MSGPPPKDTGRRQNRGRKDLGVVTGGKRATPSPPPKLCAQARDAWNGYWDDVVSGVMRPSDDTLVGRWAKNLDRYYRLLVEADNEPVVAGSTGQTRPNPIYDLAYKIEASIKDDEKQLGIGPLNRLRLGVALTEGAKSLTELNAEADDHAEDDDPRLALAD